MTTTTTTAPETRRRWPAPRFSLAAALIGMTLCAVGLWYWYRVPFEVTHEQVRYDFTHDPLDPGDPEVVQQTEWVRRAGGGKTVRQGLLTTYGKAGTIIAKEEFREGLRHGEYKRWHPDGAPRVTGQFERGKAHGNWIYHLEFDARVPPATKLTWVQDPSGKWSQTGPEVPFEGTFGLGRVHNPTPPLEQGNWRVRWDGGQPDGTWQWIDPQGNVHLEMTFDKGRFIAARPAMLTPGLDQMLTMSGGPEDRLRLDLLRPVQIQFIETPLTDVASLLADTLGTRIVLDARRIEEARMSLDAPVSCRIDNLPLVVALERAYGELPLATQLRYGLITIAPQKSLQKWTDPTKVASIVPPVGSELALAWQLPVQIDLVETPLLASLQTFSQQTGGRVQFDCSRMPDDIRDDIHITISLHGLNCRDALAALLDWAECYAILEGETIVVQFQGW